MLRRTVSTNLTARIDGLRRQAGGAVAALSSPDARWALVSTSVTALVAGAVAWLAAGAMPPGLMRDTSRDRALMPYQLFLQLAHSGDVSYASISPTFVPGSTRISKPATPTDAALTAEEDGTSAGVETHTITLEQGDTLMGALTDAGITPAEAQQVILALSKAYDPRAIHSGQSFDLTFSVPQAAPEPQSQSVITITEPNDSVSANDMPDVDESQVEPVAEAPGKLLSMLFSPSVDHDITVTRTASNTFTVSNVQKELHAKLHHAGAKIDSSLYLSAMRAGIPAEVVVEMIRMFSYEVDFQRDLQPGDSFEVLYNYYYTADGQPAKQGDITYAALHINGRTIALYRHQLNGQPADYFDSRGQSARSMLMKTPVDGARISSGFGMRFHPVLGYSRMHKGIDFAVPDGTPVMAAGSGTVQIAGKVNGYGNFVLINHGNGYSTAYGHLSRFAAGIHTGSRVRQGQVVAYSGHTGLATGPHLHYEIRINNHQVNPKDVKVASGRKLDGSELRIFQNERLHADMELANLPLESKVADATGDLRQGK
ncbi:MAG TPA: M23 family metallopeptidase [Rhizomicrobium sp.]|nr:M23 family metallopeptidase [Rhizomicrobium sp.]